MIFINPDCDQGYRFPSIGLLYMAAELQRAGLPVEYIDPNYEPDWRERFERVVPDHEYVGITANILSIKTALKTSEWIRKKFPAKKIIMGGPYPAINYAELIPKHADIAAIGEAEETIVELAKGVPLEEIKGLAWLRDGEVFFNGRRPLRENLDDIPFPAWRMGAVAKYRLEHTKGNPVLPIITSRGCPFKCIFCASRVTFESRIRYRSMECVMEEIRDDVENLGVREIHIWDDNFTLKRSRVMEFCERLQALNLKGVSLMIPAGIKPDIGDYEMFRAMKKAGFYSVCVAVESGDQEIMNKLGKKVNVEKVRGVLADARRAGLTLNGFFMLGLPFDTEETMRRNIDHACSLPLHQSMFFITIPFPGTELYDIVKEEGKFLYSDEKKLYEEGYFLGKAAYEMPGQFDAETLEKMYRLANRKFYYRPYTLLVLLLKRLYGPVHIYYLARKFLRVLIRGRQF